MRDLSLSIAVFVVYGQRIKVLRESRISVWGCEERDESRPYAGAWQLMDNY